MTALQQGLLPLSASLKNKLIVMLGASVLDSETLNNALDSADPPSVQQADATLAAALSESMGGYRAEYLDTLTDAEWEALD